MSEKSENYEKYVGMYKNGLKEGKGVLVKNNGTTYEGDFQNDFEHGSLHLMMN